MNKDQNISIIQLIKAGKVDVSYEVRQLRAKGDINVNICSYLKRVNQYTALRVSIDKVIQERNNAKGEEDKLHFEQKLQNLYKVEEDFIANTLYLAEALSKINPRTDKLKQAVAFFEEGKINEADNVLNEVDLLNDQHNLIFFVEYQELRVNILRNDIFGTTNSN